MNYYFITGTSSGLGKAIAETLLENPNNSVIGIARRSTIKHENYHHKGIDLADTNSLIKAIPHIFHVISDSNKIVLINNAGVLGQVGYIGNLENSNIENVLKINVLAPSILMNEFIKKYKKYPGEKTIINISSGAGKRPVDGWAWYCASKAALDMISQVASEEDKYTKGKVKVFSVAPGVVDTPMQEHIRNTSPQEFSRLEEFKSLKKENVLLSPQKAAEKIIYLIDHHQEFDRTVLSIRDF